jgi:uncharacterized membrane protein YraQ (UPF0718 family)/copper chaperone CopZ
MIINLLYTVKTTYLSIAPYLFIGLFFAGLLHIFFKKDFILKHLGKSNFLSVIKASILGVPLPLCSCGVIPTALYLRKKKASRGSTLSFLISTPQTGIDSIIATYGMLGPIFTIFRPLAAFVTGIVGGVAANLSFRKEEPEKINEEKGFECDTCELEIPHSHSFRERAFRGFKYAYRDFLDDISLQLVFGILIAAIISFVIPDDFFTRYGGDGILGMVYMIIFGIPLYVCATASIPIAASLIMKGISPGAAFVFLVVGPATNAATITLIANAMGRKIVAIYLSVIAVFALLGGFLLNWIMAGFGGMKLAEMHHHHEDGNVIFSILAALFTISLLLSLYRKIKSRLSTSREVSKMKYDYEIKVEGMSCNHCVIAVEKAIRSVEGIEEVIVDLTSKKAKMNGKADLKKVKDAIEESGYKVISE